MDRNQQQAIALARGDCYNCGIPGPHPVDEFGGHACTECVQGVAKMRLKYALKKEASPVRGENTTGYRLKGDVR